MTFPPLEMPIGAVLREDLKRDEGWSRSEYKDSLGYSSIGWGRLIDSRLGGGITKLEGDLLLDNDMIAAITDLNGSIPWWQDMPEPTRRALANQRFNLGWPRLASFKKMLAALERGDMEEAAKQALDSRWATQVGDRATRIAELYRSCRDD